MSICAQRKVPLILATHLLESHAADVHAEGGALHAPHQQRVYAMQVVVHRHRGPQLVIVVVLLLLHRGEVLRQQLLGAMLCLVGCVVLLQAQRLLLVEPVAHAPVEQVQSLGIELCMVDRRVHIDGPASSTQM